MAAASTPVDPRAARFDEGAATGLILFGFVLNWPLVIPAVATVLLAGSILGPRFGPFLAFYSQVLGPRLGPPPAREDPRPMRFAALVAAVLLGASTAAFVGGHIDVGWGLALIVAVTAGLSATTDLCLGCAIYRVVTGRPAGELAGAEPTWADPNLAEPTWTDPNLAEPTWADPNLAEPTWAEPNEPIRAEPNPAGPTWAEPTWAEPHLAEPIRAEPNPAGPTWAEPTPAEQPLVLGTNIAGPGHPHSLRWRARWLGVRTFGQWVRIVDQTSDGDAIVRVGLDRLLLPHGEKRFWPLPTCPVCQREITSLDIARHQRAVLCDECVMGSTDDG